MKEGELKVSQRELHRMHVVRLTIEGGRVWEEGQNFWGSRRDR
jgi:hypothetical protein